MASPFIILGCGFIGGRVARAALAKGRPVRVCGPTPAKLAPYRELGAEVRPFDARKMRSAGPAMEGTRGATVLYAVPPLPDVPSGEALHRATEAALHVGARSFIYLSSAGIYGDKPDELEVDEETTPAHDDPAMTPYHTDESAVQTATFAGLRTCTLRLAAVYGPGRGVRKRLEAGDYKLLDGGKHSISRVHVDDVVQIIFAAEERATQGSVYLVADDLPTSQLEYAEWLCKRLGLPLPPSVASYAPGMRRVTHRGRRIKNGKVKAELGVTLKYPTYVEGEQALEAEQRGSVAEAEPPPPVPTAPRPPTVVSVASLRGDPESNYEGRTEKHGVITEVGVAVGLTHIGVRFVDLPPGQRSTLPHAHSVEDEFCYVLEGTPDLWQDGHLHRLAPGDAVGFPAGTGIAHALINNTSAPVRLISLGERRRPGDRIIYPTDAARQAELEPERAWTDAPARERGPHDGLPGKKG